MQSPETILVLEDDLLISRLITRFITPETKRVLVASNVKEGLEILRSNHVDVIFADIHLPDGNGISVIREALQIHDDLVSVVVTGDPSLESAIEAMHLGVSDYVKKPFNREKIITSLRRAISRAEVKKLMASRESDPPVKNDLFQQADSKFLAVSAAMREILSLMNKVSHLDIPFLLQGEIGVGKKALARHIHLTNATFKAPFTYINCSTQTSGRQFYDSVSQTLVQNAEQVSSGKTGKGTIFLEDVEQLSMGDQKQLLEFLGENAMGGHSCPVIYEYPFRLIAATTSHDLDAEVKKGRFHRGLFDYLSLMPIKVPPLRERREAIKPLGIHFLEQLGNVWNFKNKDSQDRINEAEWETLINYEWPGNVHELAAVIFRIILLNDCLGVTKQLKKTPQSPAVGKAETISVPITGDFKSMERHMINEVVKLCGGNKTTAAKTLRMHRRTLYRILSQGEQDQDMHQATLT
ncbi:sigma-54-dependent transcriptional regulator [Gimesia panareensis]|uniref:Transcriptional regulatory protein ZraR n=1 Tax=Gimesia panareensis TaxID=2527978 RepID=A0A517Q419_9PLAN|nr:response regulator [Gimesia panareensis]QDT26364.1 Transcriptional regulatory protein ZraR [Gimesia panareensis]QDU49305.1 Transcriptional regulatory protein ZraR [Gimesia panareensis]QDV17459.1 Transcriptional regulatory protein ZraR [Gimesia panareensis]